MRAALVAVLLTAGAASAVPPTELVKGERLVRRECCEFTFWTDAKRVEYFTLKPHHVHSLIERPLVRTPPGVKAEVLETLLSCDRREMKVESRRFSYEAYVIRVRLALTATAASADGPCAVTVSFPRPLELRAEAGAAAPHDATVRFVLEVFPTRLAALRARASWLLSMIVAAMGILALAGTICRRIMAVTGNRISGFRASIFTFIVAFFAAAGLLSSLAIVMHLLDGSSTLYVLGAVVATNVAMAAAVWVAGFTAPTRLDCLIPLFATGLVLAMPLLSPGLATDFWSSDALSRPDFVLAATAVLPALAIMLMGFSGSDLDRDAQTPEQLAHDRERRDEALAALGLSAPPPAHDRHHDDLYRAHEAAFAGRTDEVAEIMEKLLPELAALPGAAHLRAAAQSILGVAFESSGRPSAARGAYERAIKEVPDHEFASRALERLRAA